MPEDVNISVRPAGIFSEAPISLTAKPARCLRCSADLSTLPGWARYCPGCGLDSYSSPPAAIYLRATESSTVARGDGLGWAHLNELAASSAGPVPPMVAPLPECSSAILRGYANAMYNLGRRYEVAAANRNPREAFRCYLKAARLGNVMAFARLAVRWIDHLDRPSHRQRQN
jgi:TPR repeat protein